VQVLRAHRERLAHKDYRVIRVLRETKVIKVIKALLGPVLLMQLPLPLVTFNLQET
jgi:hypothetical protein